MKIVAGGDSFVWGSELADCDQQTYSQNTFTALLSKHHEYICAARPGNGNDSIARSVVDACEHNTVDAVIVSWTFPGRYEFRFTYDTQQRNSPWYVITPWTVQDDVQKIEKEFITKNDSILQHHIGSLIRAKNTGIQDFAKTFYSHVGNSEYWEIYSTLKEIVYLQNYLKVNNIPYLFTCADNSIWYNYTINNNSDTIVNSLVSQIVKDRENWFWFPAGKDPQDTCNPRGFYQWALENKYKVGTTHPLEEAHKDAAKLIEEKFNAMVKKFVQ